MHVTETERANGALAPDRLASLVAAFDERVLFILENVVDPTSDDLVRLGATFVLSDSRIRLDEICKCGR